LKLSDTVQHACIDPTPAAEPAVAAALAVLAALALVWVIADLCLFTTYVSLVCHWFVL
jgi:hypothetical protein